MISALNLRESHGGILLLNKPSGISSNFALTQLRRKFSIKKMGHGGTLDPLASGLLVCALGQATKFLPYGSEGKKIYYVESKLGWISDTEDRTGKAIQCSTPQETKAIDCRVIKNCLKQFDGEQLQIPPQYSALKHQGTCRYVFARKGEIISPPPARLIQIESIHDYQRMFDAEYFSFRVQCSSGTYIRSLVRDIGNKLGCGALLSELRREANLPFLLNEAWDLPVLLELDEQSFWSNVVLPTHVLCAALPFIYLSRFQAWNLSLGREINGSSIFDDQPIPIDGRVALFENESGLFLGVGSLNTEKMILKPMRLISNLASLLV